MDAISNIREILKDVDNKGGKEDFLIEIGTNLTQEESKKLKEYLFTVGFELNDENNDSVDNNTQKMILKKEFYNETIIKDTLKSLEQNTKTTPTSKNKKENFIDKNLRMEEELAAVRAERAKQYKNSGNKTNTNSTVITRNYQSNTQSSLRRFWNFDWFTSMFSSRRRGTNQRDRLHLDSSYYRSKNTGCCGSGCGA